MSVPVVNHIIPVGSSVGDPAVGPTGGRSLVDIWGRNFREPPDPPSFGPTGSTVSGLVVTSEPQTVSVTFGGAEAERVIFLSPIHLQAITPITPLAGTKAGNWGEGSVDVVVTNLDDDGDPILGESVTVEDGFTYRHVKLDATTPSDLLRLVETLIQELKKQVIPEVVLTQSTDYDSSTGDGLNIVDIAKTPAIVIVGPDLPENRFYSRNDQPEEAQGEDVTIYRKPRTVDLLFDVIGIVSDSIKELLNLESLMNEFMDRNPFISMVRDPDDLSKGSVSYEFDIQPNGDFRTSKRPSNSNIRVFTGSILIRGFDIEGFAGFYHDSTIGKATTLTEDLELDVGIKNG